MAKNVKVKLVVRRSGKTSVKDLGEISYARLSALQVALAAALSSLASWGVSRLATEAEGKTSRSPGGHERLSLALDVDHGGGGTSGVTVDYSGISDADADEITSLLMGTVETAMK